MGLFDKLFKSNTKTEEKNASVNVDSVVFEEEYAQLKELAKNLFTSEIEYLRKTENAYDVVRDCDSFIDLADDMDKTKVANRMLIESKIEGNSSFPKHNAFGLIIHKNEKDVDYMISKVKSIKNKYNSLITFNKRKSDIPCCEIGVSNTVLKRSNLIDMPEIGFSNITKSFNKDKLLKFVVIDTETTGLKASSERIVQLSAIKYVEWEPYEIWTTYINPKRKMPEDATQVSGITDELLKDKPIIGNVSESFIEFVGDSSIVGYNLPFDLKFLFAEGIDLTKGKRKFYDVLPIARKVYKDELSGFTLGDVANNMGIYFDAHDSVNDCLATGDVFCRIVDIIV